MLSRRPMLNLAAMFMTGALAVRFLPWTAGYAWCGLVAAGLAATTLFFRPPPPPSLPSPLPDGYAEHILPAPGLLARRGSGRFMAVAAFLSLSLGMHRQAAWEEGLSVARAAIPAARHFDAVLVALEPTREHAGERGGWRVDALMLSVAGRPVSVPVSLSGSAGPVFRRGDVVNARIWNRGELPKAFPGAFDFRIWLERDGLASSLAVAGSSRGGKRDPGYSVVRIDNPSLFTMVRRVVDGVRAEAIARTLSLGGEDAGGMLAAMLYGYRKDLDASARDAFRRTGIGHVLAISGLHVGLVVGLLWWLSGWLGWPHRRRALACLLFALLYLGLSGGQVAAARATVMAVVHLAGAAWGRKSDMLNSLGLAALLLTALNPSAPADVSFQLSFTAVVFIFIAMDGRSRSGRGGETGRNAGNLRLAAAVRLGRAAYPLVLLSFATWFGLFPIVLAVFHQVNIAGLAINVVVIPLMSLVLAGGLLLPWLGWIPGVASMLVLPCRTLTALALWTDGLPYSSFPAHAPDPVWTAVFYASFLALALGRALGRGRRVWAWCSRGAICVSAGLAFAGAAPLPPPSGGRLSLLPGWRMDVLVAEGEDGGIAVIGDLSKDGWREANWLHCLKRSGRVTLYAFDRRAAGRTHPALAYHYDFGKPVVLADGAEEGALAVASRRWTPLPGAEGVEIALSRDMSGRVVWVAARCAGGSVAVAGGMGGRQLSARVEAGIPGVDSNLLVAGLRRNAAIPPADLAPGTVMALRGREAPPGWLDRDGYGALVVEGGTVKGYTGDRWLALTPGG